MLLRQEGNTGFAKGMNENKPMKTQIMSAFILTGLMLGALTNCAKKETASEEMEEWKELDSFHMLMAEVFHPLKDSGNVQPAMEKMEELAAEAEKWAAAPLPSKVDNEEMKAKLEKLKTDTRALANEIQDGAPEDQVGTTLYAIHDLFHEIQESWFEDHDHHEK